MIITRLSGGIGNQMFQYALGRVLAIKNNTELVLNIEAYLDTTPRPFKKHMAVREYSLDVFTIAGRIAKKNEIPFCYRMYGSGRLMLILDALRRRMIRHEALETTFKPFNPKLLTLGRDSYLDGFFQSYKYFIGFEEVIRNDFVIKKSLAQHITNLAQELTHTQSVCVHVRRGDFVGNKKHEVLTRDYYQKGIEYLSKIKKIEKIYVFSDDIEWCKNAMPFEFPVMFVGDEYSGAKGEGHIYLMSMCKNFVISNSTFSWWAAWLSVANEKIVISPQHWFPNININTQDLIPPTWIRL